MARKKNRDGHVVVRSEMAFDPSFEHHDEQGNGICKNRHEASEWAKKVNDATGRKIVVNPDGGIPGGSDADRRHLERERAENGEQIERNKRKRAEEFNNRLRSRWRT